MNTFLRHLVESGHAAVLAFGPDAPEYRLDDAETQFVLELDRRERLEFPGEAPALSLPAVQWAATIFYKACQLLVCRDVSPEATASALASTCPQERSPEAHYSVDLVLRYLPDLLATARRLAAGDPLVDALVRIALEWPLSSVGIAGLKLENLSEVETILSHRGLRQLYADRIIQHGDTDRIQHPGARAAVQAGLGQHAATLGPDFAPLLRADITASFPLSP